MIAEEYLKPFLLHERRDVRNEVAKYFRECYSRDGDLIPLILQACDQYGYENNTHALSFGNAFHLTEAALLDVVERLRNKLSPANNFRLNAILASTPLPLYLKHKNVLCAAANVASETLQRLERRQTLAGEEPEELFQQLHKFSKTYHGKYMNKVDFSYVDDILEMLADRGYPEERMVCELLRSPDVEGEYEEIFLIDLAGRRKLRSAIPALVEKFKIDTDFMLERVTEALAQIRESLAVHLVRQEYPNESWNYKNFTSALFGWIKCEASESACLELLEKEEDTSFRTFLCCSLCELFSERGMAVVREEIKRGYDLMITDLEEHLIIVSEVLGIDFPEKKQWMQEKDKEKQARNREQFMQKLFSPPPALQRNPILTHEEKVGRNEPCPCGSGKKYKKCHGA